MVRAINIDWLEVYCLEPASQPHTPEYFESLGYKVRLRDYGTPVYRQMFTILQDNKDWIEIRRDPYSKKGEGGFLEPTSTHIKLCNEFCYTDNPINEVRAFLLASDYTYKGISRIDICMDFNDFDSDISVRDFISRYVNGEYSKLNQAKLNMHGEDCWRFRDWSSLKWGSASSPYSTKLYNKSKELREVKDKLYIKQAWLDAGIDISKDVWRIEFSTSSQAQTRESKREKNTFKLHLAHFDDRAKLLQRFFELYEKYFDFRQVVVKVDENGKEKCVRKDRCPRITLLQYNPSDIAYTPKRNKTARQRPERTYKILINKLESLVNKNKVPREYKEAFRTLITFLIIHLSYEVREVKIKQEEEIFKLESYKRKLQEEELLMMKENAEQRERDLLKRLMLKYGYSINFDPNLPF